MSSEQIYIDSKRLTEYCKDILVSRDINEDDAETNAKILVDANLRGIDTHGVIKLKLYIDRIENGLCEVKDTSRIIKETDSMAVIDGGAYLGHIVADNAMKLALEKAKNNLVGTVFIRNNGHYGVAAYYARMASDSGMIGYTATNTAPLMAPTGGKKRLIGNNPFAFAAPANNYPSFVLDVACTKVAAGKLALARKNNEKIPFGWALDKDGNPTDDPYLGYEGGGILLPIGDHKGYGIAVMIDIITGVLSGSSFGSDVQYVADLDSKKPIGTGHIMMALNISQIMELDVFKERMDQLITEIKDCPRIDGVDEILIPGEIEDRIFNERLKNGIPISHAIISDLEALGKKAGLGKLI